MDHEQTTEAETEAETVDGDGDGDEMVELVEELLIEEISIDGMCGVY